MDVYSAQKPTAGHWMLWLKVVASIRKHCPSVTSSLNTECPRSISEVMHWTMIQVICSISVSSFSYVFNFYWNFCCTALLTSRSNIYLFSFKWLNISQVFYHDNRVQVLMQSSLWKIVFFFLLRLSLVLTLVSICLSSVFQTINFHL